MIKKIKNLSNRPFARNVLIMASGTAAAQLVSLALSPIITRVYGPEAYGLMGVFMAMVTIIGPIAALTYPIAIVLPKKDSDAKNIIKLSIYIAMGMAILFSVFILFSKETIVKLLQMEEVSDYVYLIPIVILSAGYFQIVEQWFVRKKQFRISAKVAFYQAIAMNGSKAGIGLVYPFAGVLIVISAISDAFRATLMLAIAKFDKRKNNVEVEINNELENSTPLQLAKEHRDFPLFRAPETFINAVSQNLPILMLTAFFGPASAGFYTIGKTVLNLPSQLIGKSIGDVFYPRISEAAINKENLTKLIRKATLVIGALGVLPFGIVILFGPFLFSFVFGENWVTAGEYARWIALWSFFGFMNRPSVRALPVLKAQSFQLIYTIFMLLVRLASLAIGYYIFKSDLIAIALFGISGALLNLFLILITLKISKKFDIKQNLNR